MGDLRDGHDMNAILVEPREKPVKAQLAHAEIYKNSLISFLNSSMDSVLSQSAAQLADPVADALVEHFSLVVGEPL